MDKINMKELSDMVISEVRKIMGEGFIVEAKEVMKNNGVVLHAVNIMEKEREIAPLFYLEGYEEDYEKGKTAEAIAKDICGKYIECMHEKPALFDVKESLDFEKVKQKITYKLVNAEKNAESLKEVPHREFLDLAVVYQINLDFQDQGNPTILINDVVMDKWGISEEELYLTAKENTYKILGVQINNLEDVIMGMMGLKNENVENGVDKESFETEPGKMYILTNGKNINGAACILYAETLKEFAEEHDCDFYILPSSIHESLLLPDNKEFDLNCLRNIVKEVNTTQVAPDEVLSDNVYYYSRKTGEIDICK